VTNREKLAECKTFPELLQLWKSGEVENDEFIAICSWSMGATLQLLYNLMSTVVVNKEDKSGIIH